MFVLLIPGLLKMRARWPKQLFGFGKRVQRSKLRVGLLGYLAGNDLLHPSADSNRHF